MKITVFVKKKETKEGRKFNLYIGKLQRKDGTEQTVTVNFPDEVPKPDANKCPMIIEFEKKDANLSPRSYVDGEGNEKTAYTLWLKAWKPSSEVYVDHSLDDFE